MKTPDQPSNPRQPYVTNKSDSSSPMSFQKITKQSSHESTERQILHHKQISFHVSNASCRKSAQMQVIRQINVNPTSENHPGPKNRKNGERSTPIASDRSAEPGARRWRGRGTAENAAAATAANGNVVQPHDGRNKGASPSKKAAYEEQTLSGEGKPREKEMGKHSSPRRF